jgi:hypothetical protein
LLEIVNNKKREGKGVFELQQIIWYFIVEIIGNY